MSGIKRQMFRKRVIAYVRCAASWLVALGDAAIADGRRAAKRERTKYASDTAASSDVGAGSSFGYAFGNGARDE